MKSKNKKVNIIQYSKSMDKNLRMINQNKNLNELLQDMNNINNNILKYKQIENLLKNTTSTTRDFEKNSTDKSAEKTPLLDDIKLLQNRLYKAKKLSKKENNIRIYKNNVKDIMKNIFGKNDMQKNIRYFPKSKAKLKHIKNLNDMNTNFSEKLIKSEVIEKHASNKNICVTERDNNDYQKKNKNIFRNNTIENDKIKNINFMDYASNCVKYKHPQFYLLNKSNNHKKYLPPIKVNKIKVIDLFHKNNSYLKRTDNKRNKFEKYMLALQIAGIAKFKVD